MAGKDTTDQELTGIPAEIQLSGAERWRTTKADIFLVGVVGIALVVAYIFEAREARNPVNAIMVSLLAVSTLVLFAMTLRKKIRSYKKENQKK